MAPVIELQNLEVNLGGRTILDHLNGSISGQCIGLLGPNGSGKSTLINTLLGFYPPAAGTARIFGEDIQGNIKRLRAMIGYMPESDAFISNLTGVRFVRYMAELSGLPVNQALERAHETLFYVGLGEVRYRKLGTYSLGMKQLAKLAHSQPSWCMACTKPFSLLTSSSRNFRLALRSSSRLQRAAMRPCFRMST